MRCQKGDINFCLRFVFSMALAPPTPYQPDSSKLLFWCSRIAFYIKQHPKQSVVVISLTFVAGLFESMGLMALLPLFESIVDSSGSEPSRISQYIYKGIEYFGIEPTVGAILLIIGSFIFIKAILTFSALRHVGYVMAGMVADLRYRLLSGIIKAEWSFFTSHRIGAFMNTVSAEAPHAASAYKGAVDLVGTSIQVALLITAAFLIEPSVSAASILAGLIMVFCLNYFVKLAQKASLRQAKSMRALASRLTDSLQGIKPIKTMNAERFLLPILAEDNRQINQAARMQVIAKHGLSIFREPIIVFTIIAGIYTVLEVLNTDLPNLVTMIALFYRTANSISLIQQSFQMLGASEVYYRNTTKLISDSEAAVEFLSGSGRRQPKFRKSLEFDKVCFSYGNKAVLKDVSFSIPYGKFVALYGPSGVGKTTMLDLLCALYEPNSGEILVDGSALTKVDIAAWRQNIGYVPQDLFLFHDSVIKNLTLGDETISRKRAEQALKQAECWEFVSALNEGIDTVIGERGLLLSGGQRQRLSIARAIVRDPAILILDEATTALDPDTEREIIVTLKKLAGNMTILAVSHQPAIVKASDAVLQLTHSGVSVVESIDAMHLKTQLDTPLHTGEKMDRDGL